MKKRVVFILFIIILLFSITFVLADESRQVDKAYSWLKRNTVGNWDGIEIPEHVFGMLAQKDQLSTSQKQRAVDELNDKATDELDCWPRTNCKTSSTALAILALESYGKDHTIAQSWLLSQISTPSNINWYLQLSPPVGSPASCVITYGETSEEVHIAENSVVTGGSSCFSPYQSYWFKIDDSCSNKIFNLECSQSTKANFLYKIDGENSWYVTKGTLEGIEYTMKIEAYCVPQFEIGTECHYESTLWTAYLLSELNLFTEAQLYLPYLRSNQIEELFPEAFLYYLTGDSDYLDKLEERQESNGLWHGDGSYSTYYDTAIVSLMTAPNIPGDSELTRETLLDQQDSDGYWGLSNRVLDTSMLLYSFFSRTLEPQSECEEEGYYCVSECTGEEKTEYTSSCEGTKVCCDLSSSLDCEDMYGECKPSCSTTEVEVNYNCEEGNCCKDYSRASCTNELNGRACSANQECVDSNGNIINTILTDGGSVNCCLGTCTSATQTCVQLNGIVCNPNEGNSCQGSWLPASNSIYCCDPEDCVEGLTSCRSMGGEICSGSEGCQAGSLVPASDTGGLSTCCIRGNCVPEDCSGEICSIGQSCSGEIIETIESPRCCDGTCLDSCEDIGGSICTLTCKGSWENSAESRKCCVGQCVKSSSLGLIIILIVVALLVAGGLLWWFKFRKPKEKKSGGSSPFAGISRPGFTRPGRTIAIKRAHNLGLRAAPKPPSPSG
ncbi:MAG: hypothetical protein ABH817_00585 [archaeon]